MITPLECMRVKGIDLWGTLPPFLWLLVFRQHGHDRSEPWALQDMQSHVLQPNSYRRWLREEYRTKLHILQYTYVRSNSKSYRRSQTLISWANKYTSIYPTQRVRHIECVTDAAGTLLHTLQWESVRSQAERETSIMSKINHVNGDTHAHTSKFKVHG